jgi:hypothetical protein
MAQRVYATPTDYDTYMGTVTPEQGLNALGRQLRLASALLDELTLTSVYEVDSAGHPTHPELVEVFKEAVCTQVEWFAATGDDTGLGESFSGGSIGSLTITASTKTDRYAPNMVLILRQTGILTINVEH